MDDIFEYRYESQRPIGIVTGWTGIRGGGGGHMEGIGIKAELIDDILNKPCFVVKDIIFNPPATIVLWADNTKTVVKCDKHDNFDMVKGVALCFMKKAMGNTGSYNNILQKYVYDKCVEPIKDDGPRYYDKAVYQWIEAGKKINNDLKKALYKGGITIEEEE